MMFHMKQKYCAEGDIGTTDNAWKDKLPEGVKGWGEVSDSKSEESFWEQMSNMRSMMGQSIRIPTDDASKEDKAAFNQRLMDKVPNLMQKPDVDNVDVMDAFYNQMGRPEEAEKYNAPELTAPEGIVIQDELADSFKGIAHKHGLSQKQYEGVIKDYTASSVEIAQGQLEEQQNSMKGLNDEWGMKFDGNMEKAEAVRIKYFNDVVPNLATAGADTVKAFANIADRFGKEGSSNLIEETREHTNVVAPIEAQERLNEILSNKEHAYWDAHDPTHQQAVDKVVELTKQANPKMSTDVNDLRG